jgi:hypothetical protein
VNKIKLNDILNLTDLENVKIRFLLMVGGNWDMVEVFKNKDFKRLHSGHYWNYKNKSYKDGQITIGFIRLKDNGNSWLLFHIGRITKDLNVTSGVGYEYETLTEYEKYFGRLIVSYKNQTQNMIRLANSLIDELVIEQILPDIFDDDIFPGYDKVNVSWNELSRLIENETWKTALQNQKGVYLITDVCNGKKYVGSAYGENMILGRWQNYVKSGHGGNVGLKSLDFDYIKKHFRYSILDIYKSTIEDQVIIDREVRWKDVLQSRQFGYNEN